MPKKSNENRAIIATLRLYMSIIIRGWRHTLPAVFFSAAGSTLIFYVPPLIIATLLNRSSSEVIDLNSAGWYIAIFAGVWMLGEIFWRIALNAMINFEAKVIGKLYSEALQSLLKKDALFFHNRFSGSMTKNLISYGRRFEGFLDTIIFSVTSEIFPALFAAVVLWLISPWLAIALIVIMILGFFCIQPLVKRRVAMVKAREDAHAKMSGHVSDVISNIMAIKSFGNETTEQATHDRYIDDFVNKAKISWHYQNRRIDMVVSPIYVLANTLGLAIVLSLGVDAATKANLFIGYSYFASVTRFLWAFNSVYRRLEESITEASLFTEYILDPPKILDIDGAKDLNVTNGRVELKDVNFTHSDNPDELFSSLNLDIAPGQKVGLVGQSGAGKSTIVSLLLRFMDIDSGTIKIDGQSIATVTQKSLHRSIAYVPQEPMLFHRTLRENIAYGKPNATDAEVLDAAGRANALEFIEKLPSGLDTLVGERGVKLSGGQRQRIAIARAVLKDAPILILDEATSALDSESEKLIQEALTKLMKGRTSIVIAHRLSTIAKLDRIVVLENGHVAEDGSHEQLLQQGGIYARLWQHQSGGFIEE